MTEHRKALDSINDLAAGSNAVNERVWFAACQSGLYRSTDHGRTWQDAFATLDLDQPLTTASVSPSPAFSEDHTLFAGVLGGVLRSTDGGRTWFVAELPTPPPYVVSLVVSPNYAQDGLVFAGTLEDGVFRSWDRGASWASWNFGLLDLNVFCLAASPDFARDDTLYAGVESGVFRSTNGGRAWRETAFPMELAPVLSLAISPDFGDDWTLYAGTESHGIYRSADCGETWTPTGLAERGEGIDHLCMWRSSASRSRLLAITHAVVCASTPPSDAWRELLSVDVESGPEIKAAALSGTDDDATLLVGMSDGSVRSLSLSADPTQMENDNHD